MLNCILLNTIFCVRLQDLIVRAKNVFLSPLKCLHHDEGSVLYSLPSCINSLPDICDQHFAISICLCQCRYLALYLVATCCYSLHISRVTSVLYEINSWLTVVEYAT